MGWLLKKELRQHAPFLFGLSASCCLIVAIALRGLVRLKTPELLVVPVGCVVLGAPGYCAFIAELLFGAEHAKKTFAWLAVLPKSLVYIGALKSLFGLIAVALVSVIFFVLTAAVIMFREWVPALFLGRLIVQACAYSFVWFGIAMLFAQLGRFRWLVWSLALLLWIGALSRSYQGHLFGLSALSMTAWADSRFSFPWAGVLASCLAAIATIAIGLGLLSSHGGSRVQSWYQPFTRWEKNLGLPLLVSATIFLGVLAAFFEKAAPGPALTSSALKPKAKLLEETLAALGKELQVSDWERPVLVLKLSDDPWIVQSKHAPKRLVLSVDPAASDADFLFASLPWVLEAMWPSIPSARAQESWLLFGFSAVWLTEQDYAVPDWLYRRAQLASREASAMGSAAWPKIARKLGRDVALGYAYLANDAVKKRCGRQKWVTMMRAYLPGRPIRKGYEQMLAHLKDPLELKQICAELSPDRDFRFKLDGSIEPQRALPKVQLGSNARALSETRVVLGSKVRSPVELWSAGFEQRAIPAGIIDQDTSRMIAASLPVPLPYESSRVIFVTTASAAPALRGYRILGWERVER